MAGIQLKAVSKKIKGKEVLHDINLSLEKGKIYGFVGSNGSGKSMLFRVISGLVKPTKGQVIIFDEVLHKEISFPRSLSTIFEKPGFLEQYSGFSNLTFLARIQNKITDKDIKLAIQRVGLDPEDKRAVKTYSLGMKQRLAIAQAIMERPEIILLDEPMNGLDEESVKTIYNIIKTEYERGATILMTSHNKVDIETLCHEVYKVNSGHVEKIYIE